MEAMSPCTSVLLLDFVGWGDLMLAILKGCRSVKIKWLSLAHLALFSIAKVQHSPNPFCGGCQNAIWKVFFLSACCFFVIVRSAFAQPNLSHHCPRDIVAISATTFITTISSSTASFLCFATFPSKIKDARKMQKYNSFELECYG